MSDPQNDSMWDKSTDPFIVHNTSLETDPNDHAEPITPNDRFFVVNQGKTPRIDTSTYQLRVDGDAITRSLTLRYEALLNLPQVTVFTYLECAGSQRALFEKVMGQPVEGETWTQWMLGGVGMASWTGVPLRHVLKLAGVQPTAFDVNIQGLDEDGPEKGASRPIPIDKALDPDTILAVQMNGEPLPADHGFPVRLIVPGWVGTNSIKWVGHISVNSTKTWVHRNTELYVLIGEAWSEYKDEAEPALGGPITTQNIKSSLALGWGATLTAGHHTIRGVARSPHAKIGRVAWSDDGGVQWHLADLRDSPHRHGWTPFTFEWSATEGAHTLMTRATDLAGNTQPMKIPFNRDGYMFNQVYPHPVTVISGA